MGHFTKHRSSFGGQKADLGRLKPGLQMQLELKIRLNEFLRRGSGHAGMQLYADALLYPSGSAG
jgi:hypothetical protein